jgi:hypothetical protein
MTFIETPQDLMDLIGRHQTFIGVGLCVLFGLVWICYEIKTAPLMDDDYDN